MKYFLSLLTISFFATPVLAQVELKEVLTYDGTVIQTCGRFPDPQKFPGPRPAVMVNLGSGMYDYCRQRTLSSDFIDTMVNKGVVVFMSLKRGIRHNNADDSHTADITVFSTATFSKLKTDALEAFESFQRDPRVDSKKMALWGGSEGTVISTYIGNAHPEVLEITLTSSMVEDFTQLYKRQMFEILPQEIISSFDMNQNKSLSIDEYEAHPLSQYGYGSFAEMDTNADQLLTIHEITDATHELVERSLKTKDNTFFLSDLGGKVTANWVLSGFEELPLGPRILNLKSQVYILHGTADVNTLIAPVYELELEVKNQSKNNFKFSYFEGLAHELSKEIIVNSLIDISNRLSR